MGREIHVDMKAAIDKALAAAGVSAKIAYGSYRTEPITPLNDGLFAFDNTYPDLLQMAMPSLYVAGNQRAVAQGVAANRARMKTNDIIPWLTHRLLRRVRSPAHPRHDAGGPGQRRARGDLLLVRPLRRRALQVPRRSRGHCAPRSRTSSWTAQPLAGLECSHEQVKLCGMGLGDELAVLVSNYGGLAPGPK